MDYEYLWDQIYKVIGRIRVPKCLKERTEEVVLHISDTPYSIFPALSNLVLTLKPEYIIHTGDLVDNIKLELYPKSLNRYKMYIKNLMKIMQKPFVKGIYISLGNHDDAETIKEYIGKNYNAPNLLETLHKKFYINRGELSKRFRKVTGTGMYEYLKKIKLEKAYEMLKNEDKKISEIASELGYDNYGYFSKVFYVLFF